MFDWAAARLTFPFWSWETACLKSNRPTATRIWAERIFDQRIMDYLVAEFKKDQGIDLRSTRWRCSA